MQPADRGLRDLVGFGNYAGWVFYLVEGGGSHAYVPRFLVIHGSVIAVYKEDILKSANQENVKPVLEFAGVANSGLGIEDLGRQAMIGEEGRHLHVFRLFSKLDPSRGGKLGCETAVDAAAWIGAFQRAVAKRSTVTPTAIAGSRSSRDVKGEEKPMEFTRIGNDLDMSREPTDLEAAIHLVEDSSDVFEDAEWKLFRVEHGLRFFEDVSAAKADKGTVVRAVGVVEATPDAIFAIIMSFNKQERREWDAVTADCRLVERVDGHLEFVHMISDLVLPAQAWWHSSPSFKDFCYMRHWHRDSSGAFTITYSSQKHPKCPDLKGYHRVNDALTVWEMSPLVPRPSSRTPRTLVSMIINVSNSRWRPLDYQRFGKTLPYFMLTRIAGIREYFASQVDIPSLPPEPAPKKESGGGLFRALVPDSKSSPQATPPKSSSRNLLSEMPDTTEEFFDAMTAYAPSEEDLALAVGMRSSRRIGFRQASLSVLLSIAARRNSLGGGPARELSGIPVSLSSLEVKGSLGPAQWEQPPVDKFVVRGKTYLADRMKVAAQAPLLKLMAVDWYKDSHRMDHIAGRPGSAGQHPNMKKAPFVLACNLQVPGTPNYSMVFYFVSDRSIRRGSLLDKFVNGDDAFRDARLKLIPNIAEGSWVVKRAVGTKACLLGRALECSYYRAENYLEIDVDIGSSSVARGVIGIVIGYVTSLVVDMAIVIQGESEDELPEYLLAAMRIKYLKLDSAIAPPP